MFVSCAHVVVSKESRKQDTGSGIYAPVHHYCGCWYVAYVVGLICVRG